MSIEQCTHLKVSYRTEVKDGITHGWWECDSGCGTRFLMSFEEKPKEREEFTTERYENITFRVSKDRKIVHIYDNGPGLVEMRLSSAAMHMLCRDIMDFFEDEEIYDLMEQKVMK